MPQRILDDLNEDRVPGLHDQLDTSSLALDFGVVVVDIACVEHTVFPFAKVDEGGFHAWENVAYLPQVHVPDQRPLIGAGDVVLDEYRAL